MSYRDPNKKRYWKADKRYRIEFFDGEIRQQEVLILNPNNGNVYYTSHIRKV